MKTVCSLHGICELAIFPPSKHQIIQLSSYDQCGDHDLLCCDHQSVYLFGVLSRFQHCTVHITTGSWKGRGNQYIQFVRVLYCKLPTNSKQLPAFPLEAVPGTKPQRQWWEARVLPLCHRGPSIISQRQIQLYWHPPHQWVSCRFNTTLKK